MQPLSSSVVETSNAQKADVIKKPPRPIKPAYSWQTNSTNTRLFYITDHEQANLAVSRLRKGPLGFDLEWRPNYTKGRPENPVALVQLSNEDTILLIHIYVMIEFPSKLRELLGDPSIVKAGVGIQHDCKKLYTDWRISVRNCVDLSLLARCVDNARWKGLYYQPIGLSHLLETYEDFCLPKGKIQRGNWEAKLSEIQQDYAGNDARAGLILYNRLKHMVRNMEKVPKQVYYSFDTVGGLLLEPSGTPWTASNPDYDPGPPPPPKAPRLPRAPKASDVTVTNSQNTGSSEINSRPATTPLSGYQGRVGAGRVGTGRGGAACHPSSHKSRHSVEESRLNIAKNKEDLSRTRRPQWRPKRLSGGGDYSQVAGT